MVRREILAVFEGKQEGPKSPKPKKQHTPNLVCTYTSSSCTSIKFLSQFVNIFCFEIKFAKFLTGHSFIHAIK